MGVPRPINNHSLADYVLERDESPETAIETIFSVISHHEIIVVLDGVSYRRPVVDIHAGVDE